MNLGWIFGGQAHYIAFDLADHFLLVCRQEIEVSISKNVVDEFVKDRKKALGKKWRPNPRESTVLTLVRIADLRRFNGTLKWEKPAWLLEESRGIKRNCHHQTNDFSRAHLSLFREIFRKPSKIELKSWLDDTVSIFSNCPSCGVKLNVPKHIIIGKISEFLGEPKRHSRYRSEVRCLV